MKYKFYIHKLLDSIKCPHVSHLSLGKFPVNFLRRPDTFYCHANISQFGIYTITKRCQIIKISKPLSVDLNRPKYFVISVIFNKRNTCTEFNEKSCDVLMFPYCLSFQIYTFSTIQSMWKLKERLIGHLY